MLDNNQLRELKGYKDKLEELMRLDEINQATQGDWDEAGKISASIQLLEDLDKVTEDEIRAHLIGAIMINVNAYRNISGYFSSSYPQSNKDWLDFLKPLDIESLLFQHDLFKVRLQVVKDIKKIRDLSL